MKKIFFLIIFFATSLYANSIKVYHLKNGLTYSVYPINSRVSAINVLIRAGSIYDPKGKYGLANFVAAMIERGGSIHYPPDKLLDSLDKYGIQLFSSAGKDFITIGIKFINDYQSEALKIFKDILFYPSFNYNEFLSIKKEIIGKIKSLQNNNDYLAIHQGFVNILKEPDFSHTSTGTIKDVKNISIQDLKKFYKRYFVPKNMILSFCGNFKYKEVSQFIDKNFIFKNRDINFKSLPKKLEFSNKKAKVIKNKNLKQAYIYILFPSQGYLGKDYYGIRILSFILGGNLTSILPVKIRKERGLAYSIFSTNYSMVEGGVFVIGLQTENKNCNLAINTIIKELRNLKRKGIPNKMIENAKNFFEGSIYLKLQSTYSLASNISYGIYFGKTVPPWNYDVKMIKKVSKKEIDSLLKKIFNEKKMVISIVGNVKN